MSGFFQVSTGVWWKAVEHMEGESKSPEIEWAEGLLAQARAILAQVSAGDLDLPPEEVAGLGKTEQNLTDLLAAMKAEPPQK